MVAPVVPADVVVDVESHTVVAVASAAPAADAAASCVCWSATSVAWSFATSALDPVEPGPVVPDVADPLPEWLPVELLEPVELPADVDVDASVWAVSSEASVACADASATCASMTAVWSDVGSSDATTCPAVTC